MKGKDSYTEEEVLLLVSDFGNFLRDNFFWCRESKANTIQHRKTQERDC